jgi:uncharacterized protein YjbI with pentapeptide repeats
MKLKNPKNMGQNVKASPVLPNEQGGKPEVPNDLRKLDLEIRKLQFDVATGKWLELFKAIGPVVTSLGIIGTLVLGISQLKQTQVSRDDERFERSVARLGSSQPSERLTGLAGIQQFLKTPDVSRQESTLRYLINAAVIEKDGTVRSAILDLLNSLPDSRLSNQALNQGLLAARDRNRAILKRLTDAFWQQQNLAKKRLVDPSYTEVPIGNPSPEERAPLQSSADAIAALIRAGARIDDLSSIYCVECKFSNLSTPSNLAGVRFDTSFLRRADFSGANLGSASFHNADLILTNFTSANLQSAKFSADTHVEQWSVSSAIYSGELASAWGANFACSNLSYADFTGRIIFSLVYQNPTYGGNMRDEFYNADLRGTNLKAAHFLIVIPEALAPTSQPGTAAQSAIAVIPPNFAPMTGESFSSMGIAVNYFGAPKYSLWDGGFDTPGLEIKPLPNAYRRDFVVTLASLAAARHLTDAELPQAIRSFITANADKLKKPFLSYDCKGGQSSDISDMFSPEDQGPKQTRF